MSLVKIVIRGAVGKKTGISPQVTACKKVLNSMLRQKAGTEDKNVEFDVNLVDEIKFKLAA